MFQKVEKTAFPPQTPVLVWDGKCGFCAYWVARWRKKIPKEIRFEPFQKIAGEFKDIPLKVFKTSSKLIAPDGRVFSGPDSAYRSLYLAGNTKWHRAYAHNSFFQRLSDWGYDHIARHRNFYFKLTIACFGKDPFRPRAFWLLYLVALLVLILVLVGVI